MRCNRDRTNKFYLQPKRARHSIHLIRTVCMTIALLDPDTNQEDTQLQLGSHFRYSSQPVQGH